MTLYDCLKKYKDPPLQIPVYLKHSILLDVATALEYIHSRNIIHRDLTSKNVLLTRSMVAKVSDLGQAKIFNLSPADRRTTAPGNVCFMPPEALVSGPMYTTKLDIFSFGGLILHVVTHQWPTPGADLDRAFQVRQATEVERRRAHFEKMDEKSALTTLAKKCLSNNPHQRPDATELIEEIEKLESSWPFDSTLEMQLKLDAKSNECRVLKNHIQDINLQIQATQEKLDPHESLFADACTQLREVTESNNQVLADSNAHGLIVGYQSPCNSSRNDIQLRLLQNDATHMVIDKRMEVIIRAPISINFTGTLVRTIEGIKGPWGMAMTKQGYLLVTDYLGSCGLLLYDRNGKLLGSHVQSLSKVNLYSIDGRCYYPRNVAVDSDGGSVILVDTGCSRLQKFNLSADLQKLEFLKSVGSKGSGDGQFIEPVGIKTTENGDVYICDKDNHRIQVFDRELELKRSFGKMGSSPSDFHYPNDIDFDSQGNIYVADTGHYVIKVFSPDWAFKGTIGGEGCGRGKFHCLTSICIDKHDYIYVTDESWNCVQIFNPRKEFAMQLQLPQVGAQSTSIPKGIVVDDDGVVYVSCKNKGCVHIFK